LKRWTPRSKASLLQEVRRGDVTLAEACARNGISIEEFGSWWRAFEDHGLPGLRVTKRAGT
jgi:transposase-like protein